jgi:hypothetical protein
MIVMNNRANNLHFLCKERGKYFLNMKKHWNSHQKGSRETLKETSGK